MTTIELVNGIVKSSSIERKQLLPGKNIIVLNKNRVCELQTRLQKTWYPETMVYENYDVVEVVSVSVNYSIIFSSSSVFKGLSLIML
mmetsp:Transcript_6531/g.15555  ORF Transcript_6531/g.15555 Transcript_6531/m.15555 type:complete len:87 (-) Transcript_6531:73-333(-)